MNFVKSDVEDIEAPPPKLKELFICLWLVAFGYMGGPLGPLTSGLRPPNVALQPPWLAAFSKLSNLSIGNFTENFVKI